MKIRRFVCQSVLRLVAGLWLTASVLSRHRMLRLRFAAPADQKGNPYSSGCTEGTRRSAGMVRVLDRRNTRKKRIVSGYSALSVL